MIADDDDVAIAAITIAYDLRVAEVHGQLLVAVREQRRPRGAHELIIAATARSTRRVVLTADARAFAELPDVEVRAH